MGFNIKKFESTSFVPRTAEIPVPELAEFFGKDEDPVWKVRNLNGEEFARSREAKARNSMIAAAIKALTTEQQAEKAEAIKELMGLTDGATDDMVLRLDYLVYGSVEPKIDRSAAVKLFDTHPLVAYRITNKVDDLCKGGAEPGKPKRSGSKKASEQQSSSAT